MPYDEQFLQGLQSRIDALSNQPDITLPTRPRGPVDDGTRPGWLGLLGEVLSGGQSPTYRLRGREEDLAGSRALLNFGLNMMLASGPQRVRPDLFSAAAAGLQGAQQSMDLSQRQAAAAANDDYQRRLEAAKLALENRRTQFEGVKGTVELAKLRESLELLRNRPVINADGTVSTAGGGGGTYASGVSGIEGTGKDPRSSAVSGFIDGTWKEFVAANPGMFTGMTPEQIMAARNDPNMVARATNWYAQQNAPVLTAAGITPTGQTLGIAHRVGPGAATKILKAPDDAKVGDFLDAAAVKANPELAAMTVGQLKGQYSKIANPTFLTATAPSGGPPGAVRTQVAAATPTVTTDASTAPPAPAQQPPPSPSVPAQSMPPQQPPEVTPPNAGLPPGLMSREDFRKANMAKPTPEEEASFKTPLTPEEEQAIKDERKQLEQAAEVARQSFNARMEGSEAQYTAAKKALAEAGVKAEERRRTAQKVGDDRREKFYEKERDRIDRLYEKLVEAGVKREQNEFDIQKEGAKVGFEADTHRLKKMGEAAAGSMVLGDQLRQMAPLVSKLGEPGVAYAIAENYPNLLPYLQAAGAIDPTKATDAQVFTGMANYLTTLLRPVGSGSTSDFEVRTYRSVLPKLMQTPEGRTQALAFLQNLSDRVTREHEFAQQYFNRKGPDGKPAYNLVGLADAMQKPRSQGGLGPVVPRAPDWRQGPEAMTRWLDENVESGHPYMGWGYPRDPNTGLPMPKNLKTGQPNQLELQLMVKD